MSDLHATIMNLPCDPDTPKNSERLAFKRGHKQVRHAAAELVATYEGEASRVRDDTAVAAILFALGNRNEGLLFLHYWSQGNFDVIRRDWPDAPKEIFIDADPLYKSEQ